MQKFFQKYNIHLINGDVIPYMEDYELEGEGTIIHWFEHAKDNDICTIRDIILGSAYIPKKSIAYIATAGVHKCL